MTAHIESAPSKRGALVRATENTSPPNFVPGSRQLQLWHADVQIGLDDWSDAALRRPRPRPRPVHLRHPHREDANVTRAIVRTRDLVAHRRFRGRAAPTARTPNSMLGLKPGHAQISPADGRGVGDVFLHRYRGGRHAVDLERHVSYWLLPRAGSRS